MKRCLFFMLLSVACGKEVEGPSASWGNIQITDCAEGFTKVTGWGTCHCEAEGQETVECAKH